MLAPPSVSFGPYLLDSRAKSLARGRESVGSSPSEYEVPHLLVRRPNVDLSKEALIQAGWPNVAVGDNSLEKVMSMLRRLLDGGDPHRDIKTVSRHGYQFFVTYPARHPQVTDRHHRRAVGLTYSGLTRTVHVAGRFRDSQLSGASRHDGPTRPDASGLNKAWRGTERCLTAPRLQCLLAEANNSVA